MAGMHLCGKWRERWRARQRGWKPGRKRRKKEEKVTEMTREKVSKKKIKNDLTKTDLEQLIRDKNVSDVYVVGLATEVRYYEHVANPAAMGWFAQ